MKKLSILLVVCLLSWAAQATLIDDFSSSATLTNYTHTVILDAGGTGSNVTAFQVSGGVLQQNTTTYDGIEQSAFIRTGLSLAVGEEVQVDLAPTGNQDFGLYVGGTAPVTGTRYDYIAMYGRGDGDVFTRGFDGSTEYGLIGDWGNPTYDKLFIKNVDGSSFETGYYNGTNRVILGTRTPAYTNAATYVGFYTDVRASGVLGDMDNLTIIPEPVTIALLGLGGLLIRRKR